MARKLALNIRDLNAPFAALTWQQMNFNFSEIEVCFNELWDNEELLRKEVDNHTGSKDIHKTSEQIRAEIEDEDIPDSVARTKNIEEHNVSPTAHNDIRERIAQLLVDLANGDAATLQAAIEALSAHNVAEDAHADIRLQVANALTSSKSYTDGKAAEIESRLVHDLGAFATPEQLRTAHPTANAGDMALVQSTDTVWVWSDSAADWVDTDKKGEVTDAQFQAHVADSSMHLQEGERERWDSKAAGTHTHPKSQITDFPASLPASDVPAWAKAASKPTYNASEVGALPSSGKITINGVTKNLNDNPDFTIAGASGGVVIPLLSEV